MKKYINFKHGIYLGILMGIIVTIYGFVMVQNMMEKAENVASIDLNQFEYQDLEGNEVKLSDYSDKNILVNFWATWCGPCLGEFPLLNETFNIVNEDMAFLMVSYESIDKIKGFAEKSPYDFIFLKSSNFMMEGISTVPQSFIINKQGDVVHHHSTIFENSSEVLADSLRYWVAN